MKMPSKVCCICLKTTEVLQSLISDYNSEPRLQRKLEILVPEQTWLDYYLICTDCCTELNRAYNFKLLCAKHASFRKASTFHLQDDDSKSTECNDSPLESFEEQFNCYHCQKSFKSKATIESHLQTHHNKAKFTCDKCSQPFALLKDIIEHCKLTHAIPEKDIRPYKCPICSNSFRTKTVLAQHQKYHETVRAFVCSTCGKDFFTKQDLLAHENYHDDHRRHLCTKCDKSFITKSNLTTHILVSHTDKSEWKYSCVTCSNKFALKSHLTDHEKRHESHKNFSCHICDKSFVTKTELKVHTRNHSNIKRHRCTHCTKCYRDKRNLKVHLSREHGEGDQDTNPRAKSFICDSCPKRFVDKYKLNRHLRTHSGVKPFSCSGCSKQFSEARSLRRHMGGCEEGNQRV